MYQCRDCGLHVDQPGVHVCHSGQLKSTGIPDPRDLEIAALKERIIVLEEALLPFNVLMDFHGAKHGGMGSLLVYRDDIEAVKAALINRINRG